MRTIIDLKESQLKNLAEICARDRISRSEAIRKAVDMLADTLQHGSNSNKAFGLWKGRKLDSLDYLDELRKEWDS